MLNGVAIPVEGRDVGGVRNEMASVADSDIDLCNNVKAYLHCRSRNVDAPALPSRGVGPLL